MNTKNIVWILVIAAAAFFLGFYGCNDSNKSKSNSQTTESKPIPKPRTITLAQYEEKCKNEINRELQKPTGELRKSLSSRVENAHKTVTVKNAYVSQFIATTTDGRDVVFVDNPNISEVVMRITTKWDGIFHRNGFTDLEIVYRMAENNKMDIISCKIVDTNASVNTEDPNFWYKVGAVAGALILL